MARALGIQFDGAVDRLTQPQASDNRWAEDTALGDQNAESKSERHAEFDAERKGAWKAESEEAS